MLVIEEPCITTIFLIINFCYSRAHNGPVIIASPSGGTDIENVAEKTPHLIKTIPLSIYDGITPDIANEVAAFLEFSPDLQPKVCFSSF